MTIVLCLVVGLHCTLTVFFAVQLERERVRHRAREAALTDRLIEVTSTKRWEDMAALRKEMFLLSKGEEEVKPVNGAADQVPEEIARTF